MIKLTNPMELSRCNTITVSTVKILCFLMSIQTEETKIRLLLSNQSDQGLHSYHSICTFV